MIALILKDLRHHLVALGGFFTLGVAGLIMALSGALANELDSLVRAGTGFVYYAGPLVVLGVTRRLFVVERLDGSHAFLATLPTSPVRVAAVRYVVGLVGLVLWAWGSVGVVALLVSRQELLAADWLLQIAWQCAAYVSAWFALGFAFAQLGRWRFAGWLVVLAFLFSAEMGWNPKIWNEAAWHAVLSDAVDQTRYAAPLRELAVTLTWTVGATGLGFLALAWRHGDLAERAWAPMTTRGRAALFAGFTAYMAGLDLLDAPLSDDAPRFASLPTITRGEAVVRVADSEGGRLRAHADALAVELDGMGGWLGLDWPDVVLLPADSEPRATVWAISGDAEQLVLRVDAAASRARVLEGCLHRVVSHETGWQLDRDDPRAWVVAGLPSLWLERTGQATGADRTSTTGRRAAWAASRGITDLSRWGALRGRLGPDASDAVAWAGLRALQGLAGEERALAFVQQVLVPRGESTAATLLARASSVEGAYAAAGVDRGAHEAAWMALLEELAAENADAVAQIPILDVRIGRETDREGRPWLSWTWEAEPVAGAELRWYAMEDLVVVPTGSWPQADDTPADADGRVGLDVDPRDAVAATIVVWTDVLDAEVQSGWTRLSPVDGR